MPDSIPLNETVVIFDLDGTLVDSAPDLVAAMNVVLQSEGYSPLPLEQMRHLVGHGARALLVAGFAAHGIPDVPEADMLGFVDKFIEYYRIHMADASRPFPGCVETLVELQSAGAKLAVCTNKREELTYPLLKTLQLDQYFDTIICRDTLPVFKPDPAPLHACIDRTNARHGIMVGDTDTDLNAARAAHMPCLIAAFGYGDFTSFDQNQMRYFDSFTEIPHMIREILEGD